MYIQTSVLDSAKKDKYAVAGREGQITCVFNSQEEASKQAKKWVKQGHQRSSIICKFASVDEIIKAINNEIDYYKNEDLKLNSPESARKAYNLEEVKRVLLNK